MASPTPLKGLELIDCAKANAKQGIETAAELCGYGSDYSQFQQELKQACQAIGVEVNELSDLLTDVDRPTATIQLDPPGVEIGPGLDGNL
ncbi:hypothetical protein H6F67_17555 [Microcoleus sp. FACHB-1515]|uniref:hypothetical protein n=1 Tax=Cyanophyceae TaxID=3028117 RepID=UPI00168992E4|nr:hypothetical protein [Microcoleus sp. FACHB-1515]MBD2091652.1 hypothetical protein [Microcoleus sp. FACHB-1515]